MSIVALKKKCLARVEEAFQLAEAHYGKTIKRVPVVFSSRQTRTAGTASYRRNRMTGEITTSQIKLSVPLLQLNTDAFIEETPGHETAHIIAMELFQSNGLGHGYRWQEVMRVIGQNAKRCHSFEVPMDNREHAYCGCDKPHVVSKTIANRLRRGNAHYSCKRCNATLSLTKQPRLVPTKISAPVEAPVATAPRKVTVPKKTTVPRAPKVTNKKQSKADIVRKYLAIYKDLGTSLEGVLATEQMVMNIKNEAGLTKALCITYIKNNWNKA